VFLIFRLRFSVGPLETLGWAKCAASSSRQACPGFDGVVTPRTDPGYRAIQQIPGVGPVLAAVFVAEIGDITRFHRPEQLASWAGLSADFLAVKVDLPLPSLPELREDGAAGLVCGQLRQPPRAP
jgi:Transposase IS116/IS110/IS902 family